MILMQNLRKNHFTLSKIKRIWWVLIRAHKSLQNLHFDLSLLCKVHNVWPWKNTEELSFMTLKSYAKFEKKLTCGLENNMRNLTNFHQNTRKCQNWCFPEILLFKVENAWAKDLQRTYVLWQWKMMQKLERNWLATSKLTWGI